MVTARAGGPRLRHHKRVPHPRVLCEGGWQSDYIIGSAVIPSLVVVGNAVYVGSADGNLYALR
jgi:hypothetical protein